MNNSCTIWTPVFSSAPSALDFRGFANRPSQLSPRTGPPSLATVSHWHWHWHWHWACVSLAHICTHWHCGVHVKIHETVRGGDRGGGGLLSGDHFARKTLGWEIFAAWRQSSMLRNLKPIPPILRRLQQLGHQQSAVPHPGHPCKKTDGTYRTANVLSFQAGKISLPSPETKFPRNYSCSNPLRGKLSWGRARARAGST